MSELNPLGLWPGQERGGVEKGAGVGAQGKVEVGSKGTRGCMGMSRMLEGQAGQSRGKREGMGGLGEPRKVQGPLTRHWALPVSFPLSSLRRLSGLVP